MISRLAVITTHPIQYNAPLFAKLVERGKIQLRVFYTWERQNESIDPGFGKAITWDRPLLDGYDFQFSKNVAKDPGSHHYAGIDNPDLVTEVGDWKPDGILVYGWKFRSHLGLMRHFRGRVPILFRGDSHLLDELPGWRSLARRAVIRFVMRYVDKALYVGEANKAYFIRHGVPKDRLVRAPHAVDNDYFSADDVERRRGAQIKRQALGIDPDRVVMLVGSTDRHYTASKTFQCLLSRRPVFALLHKESTAAGFLAEAKADDYLVTFDGKDMDGMRPQLRNRLELLKNSDTWSPDLSRLEPHSAKQSACVLAENLDELTRVL